MNRCLTVSVLWLVLRITGLAAPDPPFEALLLRAKNVLIVSVISTDGPTISFQIDSVLRGNATRQLTLSSDIYDDFKKGSKWILLSQGDNRFGEPREVLGRPMEGQGVWCGWTPLPLFTVGGNTYAGRIFALRDGKIFSDIQTSADGPCLELSRLKRLIESFPYNPDINK